MIEDETILMIEDETTPTPTIDSPENHRVDIPEDVLAEIMANASKKMNRLLGLNFI